jgi:flavin reductase (DIM6/NTAB) family NADH-FMN oxidoreductase RutF
LGEKTAKTKKQESMMALNKIPPNKFIVNNVDLWSNKWLVLTSGDFEKKKFNAMIVGWGSLGVMWNKPYAQVVVRPTRYTYNFMEQHDTFTLCAFPEKYRKSLDLLGSKSGRYGDKITQSGLQAIASIKVAAPAFAEAELIIECRKIYWDDFKPDHFLEYRIHSNYPLKDYHRIYFGEIVTVLGEDKYMI